MAMDPGERSCEKLAIRGDRLGLRERGRFCPIW